MNAADHLELHLRGCSPEHAMFLCRAARFRIQREARILLRCGYAHHELRVLASAGDEDRGKVTVCVVPVSVVGE